MSVFYLTLLAVLVSGLGARDQVTVAGLSRRQGKRPSVLITASLVAVATAAFAAWASTLIAPVLAPQARLFLAAVALAFAGAESLILAPRDTPREPTHSLFATAIVLLSHQLTDAARFLVFGIAVAGNFPLGAAFGGALGGMAVIAGGWAFPEIFTDGRMRSARRVLGGVLLLVALYAGLKALGRI